MSVGIPRNPTLTSALAARYDEIDTQLQYGVLLLGSLAVVASAAMVAGALEDSSRVTLDSARSSGSHPASLHAHGHSYTLEFLAVASALVVTAVASAMAENGERIREGVRVAYAHIDDLNLDEVDRQIDVLLCGRSRRLIRAPYRNLSWRAATTVSIASTIACSLTIALVYKPRQGHEPTWPLIVLMLLVINLAYLRTATVVFGNLNSRPRDRLSAIAAAFVLAFFGLMPLFAPGLSSGRDILVFASFTSLPALATVTAVVIPTWKRLRRPALLAAFGLVMATSNSYRATSIKVGYLNELQRTAGMDLGVAANSRRRFEQENIRSDS
jgi:hypothetical protein